MSPYSDIPDEVFPHYGFPCTETAISVIVPFFRVECFIGRCVESLMRQTMTKGVEFIFVDDGSDDGSRRIVEEKLSIYPGKNARILSHEYNMGLPAARNTGLAEARGKYIIHCDSDDYMDEDMLESLYRESMKCPGGADVVICDYYESHRGKESVCVQPVPNSSKQALSWLMDGKLRYNVWNKLVKRELYDKTRMTFPTGYSMGEDTTMIVLLAVADRILVVNRPLYHYVQYNGQSITKKALSERMPDIIHNTGRIFEKLGELGLMVSTPETASFRLLMKWPLLTTGKYCDYLLWKDCFPDIKDFLIGRGETSMRIKIVEYLAYTGQWWAVWLHYWIVIKLYYSLMYR